MISLILLVKASSTHEKGMTVHRAGRTEDERRARWRVAKWRAALPPQAWRTKVKEVDEVDGVGRAHAEELTDLKLIAEEVHDHDLPSQLNCS